MALWGLQAGGRLFEATSGCSFVAARMDWMVCAGGFGDEGRWFALFSGGCEPSRRDDAGVLT